MQSAAAIWENSLKTLKAEMTEVSFNTWVLPLEPICADEETLVMMAQNDIAKKTLQSIFGKNIEAAVNRANHSNYMLYFIEPSEKDQYVSEEAEESDRFILNPKYTFDNFVVGGSNNFAQAAALAVAENPSSSYNPLFLYGGVGLGKTHLMHAIGNRIHEKNPNYNIVYVTSETFTFELIESISENSKTQFRNKYRTADILMVDDIQFIAGKNSTQEEFFNTFNALHTAGKQIILSSDRPPRELTTLEERLRSRFEGGLITDIQPPDLETRIAILRKKALAEGMDIDETVLLFIAERVKSNVRQLEGALTRVISYARFTHKKIDVNLANTVLKDIIAGYETKAVTIELIQQIVADYYHTDVESMLSQRRTMEITLPRQIAMFLCKEMTDKSLKAIGRSFGGRDHTTVMNAEKKIRQLKAEDPQFSSTIDDIIKRIKK